jgi:L-rhamnose mutarotase
MRNYCIVIELKDEHVEEYIDLHKNAWPEMLKEIKQAGVKQESLYNYKNLSIVFFECDDIDAVYAKLKEKDIVKKWDATVGPWFASEFNYPEKIFDLNEQLKAIENK